MLNKIYIGIIIFLCFALGFYVARYNLSQFKISKLENEILTLKNDVSNCKTNLNDCNKGIEEFNNAQIQASSTIQKIKTVVKTVKEDCDCFNSSVDDRVLLLVRKQE